jgi:hypothetical protein
MVVASFSLGGAAMRLQEIRRTLKRGRRAIIHHANTLSSLGWKKFLADVPLNVARHKTFDSFSIVTLELMRELATRAGLEVVEQREDIVPRDAVTYLRARLIAPRRAHEAGHACDRG